MMSAARQRVSSRRYSTARGGQRFRTSARNSGSSASISPVSFATKDSDKRDPAAARQKIERSLLGGGGSRLSTFRIKDTLCSQTV